LRTPYLIATVAYCGFLWVLSSDPTPPQFELPFEILGLDKVIHAALYAVLGGIVSVGIRKSGRNSSPWTQCFVPILFAALYGAVDEIHQIFVPNRDFDLGDILADLAGAAIIQMALLYVWWRRPINGR
jgi:VanZ family protein